MATTLDSGSPEGERIGEVAAQLSGVRTRGARAFARSAAPGRRSVRGRWRITPHRTGPWQQLREMWRARGVLAYLVPHFVLIAYSRTILGLLWLLIRPFVMVVGYTFVFRDMLGVKTGDVPYPLFVLCGLFGWLMFQRGLAWTTRGLYKVRSVIDRVYFPRLLAFASTYGPAFVESAVVLLAFLAAIAFYYGLDGTWVIPTDPTLLMAFPIVLWLLCAISAVSLFASVGFVYARDVWFTMRYAIIVMLFATPVLYPVSALPEAIQPYVWYNPLSPIFVSLRAAVFGTDWPPLWSVWTSLGSIGVLNALGLWFFVRWESRALDDLA